MFYPALSTMPIHLPTGHYGEDIFFICGSLFQNDSSLREVNKSRVISLINGSFSD